MAIIYIVSPILGVMNLLDKEIFKLLVQIEATILGFFGIVFVQILNSLDARQDRYEKRLFDINTSMNIKMVIIKQRADELRNNIESINNSRKTSCRVSAFIFVSLCISMVLSIYLSAIIELEIFNDKHLLLLSVTVMALFLISFIYMILLFSDIANRFKFPKKDKD